MTIQNTDLFMSGLWDWAILDGCFGGTKIKPTDIDGFIERNGKFLVIETKRTGAMLKNGQMIMFKSMIKTGVFTVVIVWGMKNCPTEMQVFYPPPSNPTLKKIATIDDLRRVVNWWFINADI